jgi:ketosteroid isomerase-like protein
MGEKRVADLAFLEAFVGISDTKGRYCRCLDTKDWEGYGDVFTDDVILDTRPAGGSITHGRDALLKIVRSSVETAKTAHQVHTPLITLDGDTAHVVWAMEDRVVWGADRIERMGNYGHTGYGHYTERYVKQDGRWRIAETVLSRLHVDVHTTPPATHA